MKKVLKMFLKIVLIIIVLMIALIILARTYIHVGPYKSWTDRGIGLLLPSLSDALGKSEGEFYIEERTGSDSFVAHVYGISQKDFQKYIDAVMKSGFTLHYYRSETHFDADHITLIRIKNLSLWWTDETNDPYKPPCMSVYLL